MKKESEMRLFFTAILLTIVMSLFYYILFNITTDSDLVEGVFWANASIESKSIVSDTFFYPYAIPFGANLLFSPFVKIYGISLLSNRLGMVCFFAFFLLTVFYFAFSTGKRYGIISVILCCIGILMAFRTRISKDLLNHILFYLLGYINMLGILAAINMIDSTARKRHYAALVFYVLWGASNGIPSIALSVFPAIVGLAIIALEEKGESHRTIVSIGIIFCFTFLGLICNKAVVSGAHESEYMKNVGSFNFLPVQKWFENLSTLPLTWFGLFFRRKTDGVFILSLQGVEIILEILLALVITVAPVLVLIDYKKARLNTAEKAVLFSSLTVWMVCLAQYVLFRGKEERLLYNCVLVNSLLLAVWAAKSTPESMAKKLQKGAMKCISFVLAAMFVCFAAKAAGEIDLNLVHELERHRLTYGFASYWNANYNTVLSNNTIKIRDVSISKGIIKPHLYNSDTRWYNPQDSDFFILLTQEEFDALSVNKYYEKSAKETFAVEDFYVMVYDQGLWENFFDCPVYDVAFRDNIWSQNCDTVNSVRYIHDGGLTFGPYLHIRQGICTVSIQGKALSHATIVAYSSQNKNYEIEYTTNTDEEISFKFYVEDDTENLEIAIKNSEQDDYQEDILISSIVIVEQKPEDTVAPYAEE